MCPIRFRTSSALRLANQFSGVLVIVVCLIPSLLAQVDRAGLSGAVTDPSGRVLPQTHITAVQTSTDLKRETVSSANGTYYIPELPVGVYSIILLLADIACRISESLELQWRNSDFDNLLVKIHFKRRQAKADSILYRATESS